MVDDYELFISGPAAAQTLQDNQPVRGRYDFSLMRVQGQTLQLHPAEDPFYGFRVIDEAYDLHFMGALRAAERVHFPDLLDELPSCFGRHPA